MAKTTGYRKYYSFTLEQLRDEDLKFYNEREAERNAKKRLRMYANLFNRDCREALLNKESKCCKCESKENLTIDHIIPVTAGGKNEIKNTQILCSTCNIKKGNGRK